MNRSIFSQRGKYLKTGVLKVKFYTKKDHARYVI